MAKSKKINLPYGEGTIFYSNSAKRWMGQVNIGKDENGKYIRKSVYGKDANEVKQKLQQIKYDIYTGDFISSSRITFEQLEKQILEDKYNLNELKEQTYYRNLQTLNAMKKISIYPLQEINLTMIKHFMLSLIDKYSQSQIDKIYFLLNECFREAVKRKILKTNPIEDMKKPKSRKKVKKIRALTLEEEKKFIDSVYKENSKYKYQMLISLFTGMRMGEVNALRPEDINFNFNFINVDKTISKGQKGEAFINDTAKTEAGSRTLPMNKFVKPLMKEIIQDYEVTNDGQLFHTSRKTLVTTSMVNTEFKKIIKKYNIQDKSIKGTVSLHSLRHTYATRCIEAGMQPKVLQKLLGHTDIRITLDTYSDVFDKYQEENIAKVDKYLEEFIMAG